MTNLGHVLECGGIFGDREEQRIRDGDERDEGDEEELERWSHGEARRRRGGWVGVKGGNDFMMP